MNFYRRRRSYSAGRNDFLYDNGISFFRSGYLAWLSLQLFYIGIMPQRIHALG